MEKLRVGLVGMSQGWYATLYSRACAQRKDVDFIGICDLGESQDYVRACAEISAEEFSTELKVPLFHQFNDLMRENPGALIVTSETGDHHRYVLPAIEAGVHVFVGKPLTTTLANALEIHHASMQRPDVVVQPGEPARYEEAMIQARNRVMAGEIGRPLMARLYVNHPTMTNHEWQMRFERSGGPFIEFGTYVADLAEWVLDSPIHTVFAQGRNFLHPQVDGPDNAFLLCEHQNGAFSSLGILCSIRWNYPFLDMDIVGEKGCLRADYHNYPLVQNGAQSSWMSEPRYSPMNQREIDHFLECVLNGKKPVITPEDYVSTIAVMEAAHESLSSHAPVRVSRS
jgi:predicted dehydrogenase